MGIKIRATVALCDAHYIAICCFHQPNVLLACFNQDGYRGLLCDALENGEVCGTGQPVAEIILDLDLDHAVKPVIEGSDPDCFPTITQGGSAINVDV